MDKVNHISLTQPQNKCLPSGDLKTVDRLQRRMRREKRRGGDGQERRGDKELKFYRKTGWNPSAKCFGFFLMTLSHLPKCSMTWFSHVWWEWDRDIALTKELL